MLVICYHSWGHVGTSESLLLFRYCHSLPNTHRETELLEAENLWDTEKHHTLEGFLFNRIGLERRAEYFSSNSTISIEFEGLREIHYKYKHSLELYIWQFFLFWKTNLQGFIIWWRPLHKPGQHSFFLFIINICNLQEIFLKDAYLKSRENFLSIFELWKWILPRVIQWSSQHWWDDSLSDGTH